jgi:two-component system response regulator HydG
MTEPRLLALARSGEDLPSLPHVVAKVVSIAASPEASVAEIAAVVEKDAALAARVLRVVNSPFYGLLSRIGSLQQAVAYLGLRTLRSLCLGLSIGGLFRGLKVELEEFWRHSLFCAVSARQMAPRRGVEPEEAFVAGLLQNIGLLVAFKHLPPETVHGLFPHTYCLDTLAEEQAELGCDHTVLGELLAQRWNLPESMVAPLRFHHSPELLDTLPEHPRAMAEVVCAANDLYCLPQVDRTFLPSWLSKAEAAEVLRSAQAEVRNAADYFGLNIGREEPLEELILKANQALAAINQEYEQERRAQTLEAPLPPRQAQEPADGEVFEGIIGQSAPMRRTFELISKVARYNSTVLVTGETGTGKEMVARALHRLSPRKDRPLVVCNCSALVETLLESELFGHVKGAFTGAHQAKEGLFEVADGGTIFLDEIGEISPLVQVKLLRVLEAREVQRVGSTAVSKVDVRVVAATNKDLKQMVAEGRFREDLYHRLNVIGLRLPPLRERGEDLRLLIDHFLASFCRRFNKPLRGFSAGATARLLAYPWTGNVRELENAVESAVIMAAGPLIETADLPEHLKGEQTASPPDMQLSRVEEEHVRRILQQARGNKVLAARLLGMSRRSLYRKLEKFGIGGERP